MTTLGNPLLLSPEGYQIERSVRLRSSASAYFNRTPASAGNRTTWTWSAWVKRGTLGAVQYMFSGGTGTTDTTSLGIRFGSDDALRFTSYTTDYRVSSAVFRDVSAWYHVVVAFDTTQATAANRIKIYVNGVQLTSFATSADPVQNTSYGINQAASHSLGRWNQGATSYTDGYLTEVNFIDGQALTPDSFGETDAVTGVWKPKKYAGTYGTNGFYLNFSDNSAATAAAIGKDNSGNGNNWTPNNISVTSGATYDSMLDVPTPWADGGNGRGNYAVLNPLDRTPTGGVWSDGNLTFSYGTTGTENRATIGPTSGKWVAQVLVSAISGNINVGLFGNAAAQGSTSARLFYRSTGEKVVDGVVSAYGASYTTNDVIRIEADYDAGTVTFYKNNVSQGAISYTLSAGYAFAHSNGSGTTVKWNFGQQPWFNSEAPTTGFKALQTGNLPTPTILKGNQYFDASTWTGNGSSQAIVNSGAMQPDLVWVKGRSVAYNNYLEDSVRGAGKDLSSNSTDAEATYSLLSSFNSNGFTVYTNGTYLASNQSGTTYVGWQWKESATAGFDIVTYTGTGSARTVAHSLGVAPRMIIVKQRNGTQNWIVGHESMGWGSWMWLDLTNGIQTNSVVWNNTAPTSSVFTVGTGNGTNQSGFNYVAYLFAEVPGFSRFGSYTGNGSADGPFVFCGFRPAFVMVKASSAAGESWALYDNKRDGYNIQNKLLYPNLSNAENAGVDHVDLLSNGFKLRSNNNNTNGVTYIYAAFAENPFKNALAR